MDKDTTLKIPTYTTNLYYKKERMQVLNELQRGTFHKRRLTGFLITFHSLFTNDMQILKKEWCSSKNEITSPFAKRVSLFLPMSPAKKLRWNTLQISLYRLFFSCHDEPELKMAFFSILSRQNAWTIIYGPCIFTVVRASLIGPCFSLVKMHGPTLILNWSVRD